MNIKQEIIKNMDTSSKIEPPGITLFGKVDGEYVNGIVFTPHGIVQAFQRPLVPGRNNFSIWLSVVTNFKRFNTRLDRKNKCTYDTLKRYARTFSKTVKEES